MQLNPLEQNDTAITTEQLNTLKALAIAGNFSEFYAAMHSYGSTMAGLYIPGPAGVGLFGSYSHLISSDATSTEFFRENQYLISTNIANAVIGLIEDAPNPNGGFYLPSVHRLLAEEIEVFTSIPNLGSEAYAGHDLINFLGITGVPGAIPGGVQGNDFSDGVRAAVSLGTDGGVFEYAGATLNESDIYRDGNLQRIVHPTLGDIPVGVTTYYTLELLNALSEEVAVRQNPDNFLSSFYYSTVGYQGISALRDGKFVEIMNSIYGDAETSLSDGGVVIFNENGSLTIVESSYLANQYRFLERDAECFTAGTEIRLHDGTSKSIEDIAVGDVVLSYDRNGNAAAGYVERTFTNVTSEFVVLSFSDGRTPLVSTRGHRFLSETGDYEEIGRLLQLGGGRVRLVGEDGTIVTATGEVIAYSSQTAEMFAQAAGRSIALNGTDARQGGDASGWQTYNFEVRTHHNYVAGAIRVHNDSILTNLQAGDTLLAVNSDLTNAAVLRDMNGDGTADFVTLEGFRDPANGQFSTQLERANVSFWNDANGDLDDALADIIARGPDALTNVFDPGNGNTWNDGAWGDDIEEAYFDDVFGATGDGAGHRTSFSLYDQTIVYVDGAPVAVPDVSGAADPIALLGLLSGLIAVIDGLKPAPVTYALGNGDVNTPPFVGVSGVAAVAFVLGMDLGFEIIPAITVDGPFGPIEVSPALTLGGALENTVADQSQFDVVFAEGIAPADVTKAQNGNDLVMTIDNGNGTTSTLTLEGVYADGNADEIASVIFADGTELALGDIPVTSLSDGVVTGTDASDLIDPSFADVDGDFVGRGDDNVSAGLGDDTLVGGGGDDTLDGGAGTDTAELDGLWDEFVFSGSSVLIVTDMNTTSGVNEGTDNLIDIEAIAFTDGNRAEVTQSGGSTVVTSFAGATAVTLARTVLDTADTYAWSNHRSTYAADGTTLTEQVFTYDDGRMLDRDFDAAGVRVAQTMTDAANVHAWSEYTATYSADGTMLTDQVFTYDDGRVLDREYDAAGVRTSQTMTDGANVHVWTDHTATYGADGTSLVSQLFNYDDGRTLERDFDASGVRTSQTMTDGGNVHAWTDYTSTYGADGTSLVDQVYNYDDGRVLDRDFDASGVRTSQTMTDHDNAHAWASYTSTYAADGTTLVDQVLTYDDGRIRDRDFDTAGVTTSQTVTDAGNVHAWTDHITTFGADGTSPVDQVFTYDDGRSLDRDFDASGMRTSQIMTDVEDAYSWASYTQTFGADGTLLDTVYTPDPILG